MKVADMVLTRACRTVLAGCTTAILVGAPDAHAQLQDAVDRIANAWRSAGGWVEVDKTRFLRDDETTVVRLPDLPEGECTTIALIGARVLGFHVRLLGDGEAAANQHSQSEAGALSIERCGEAQARRIFVTSDSGRGALETVVARSAKPLPALQSILPERTGGLGPFAEAGALPALAAPEKRADLAEARAKRDGASVAKRAIWHSGVDGAGLGEVDLSPGCHGFQLFALDPNNVRPARRTRLDLDAEMRDRFDDRLLARDRTDAPDARLSVCVGEPTRVGIAFVGSPPEAPVLISHVAWPLPEYLPSIWGSEARGRMAQALLARHVVSLPAEPVVLAQGGSGTTVAPLSIEPGGCYLALVSLVQGMARALSLHVRVAAREVFDDREPDDNVAMVAFCAGEHTRASAQVQAHGTALLGWGLAVYHVPVTVWDPPP
jgi:hypothetical protein